MGKFKITLPVQTYQARNKSVTDQRLLNMFAEEMPDDSKNSVTLYNTEGCKPLLNIAEKLDIDDAPVYGLYYMNPYLYVFMGVNVYRVDSSLNVLSLGNIGAINGTLRMADNGTQLMVVKPNGDGYIVTSNAVTYIDDEDWPSASDVTFNSQYFVVTKKSSGRFYWSALLDGTDWSALAYATQESNPDNVVGIIENKGDLWIFGDKTTEIWTPSGNPDLPFYRIGSGILNVGCKATGTIAKDKNGIYWLGNDLQVHFAGGYNPERISTHDIERELAEDYAAENVGKAFGFTYSSNGHDFYVLTIPNSKTWVFDFTTGVWHERQTQGTNTWIVSSYANAFNMNIVGDSQSGKLYVLDYNYYKDKEDLRIDREIIFPPVFLQDSRMIFDKLYLDLRTAPSNDMRTNPAIMLSWSDDGGKTWSSEHWKTFGKTGEYHKRVIWRCLGQARERIFKMRITDAVKVEISGLYGEGDECYA